MTVPSINRYLLMQVMDFYIAHLDVDTAVSGSL